MIQERLGVLVATCAARKCLKQRTSAIAGVFVTNGITGI